MHTFVEQSHPEFVRALAVQTADRISPNAADFAADADPGLVAARVYLNEMIADPQHRAVVLTVEPAMARALLELNTSNRPASGPTLKKYEARMRRGWKLTGETIIVSRKGVLLNGQHRLRACISSGRSFEVFLAFGIDDDAFAYMDIGKTRGAADIFSIYGVPNAAAMSAASLWVWKYQNTGMMEPASWLKPTHDQLYEFFKEHHGLQKSYTAGHRFADNKVAPQAIMTALHYLCSKVSRTIADDFFEKVATGIGLKKAAEPAAKLRKRLLDDKIGGRRLGDLYVGAYTVMVWNAMRQNNPVPLMRWRGEQNPDQPFPRIV
ncbi:hypothetical protein [Azospirillum sp.]|uniref:hypothetical protein n=1 Tax=Azospirillum sp. TaxID=34012 RepID=UPI003D723C2C